MRTVNVLDLNPGDRILTDSKGTVATVTKRSTVGRHNSVTIHTDRNDYLTGLPCTARVLQPR